MTDEQTITERIAEIATFADQYPGAVIVLTGDARRVLYMSNRGLQELNTTMAELLAFCVSDRAGYLTGTDILNDGGVIASMTERARRNAASGQVST